MDVSDVISKMKRKNKILFSKDSDCLLELSDMISKQNRRTLILWAFECGEKIAKYLTEKYPDDDRPEKALTISRQWSHGMVKMKLAQRAILDVHSMAKDITDKSDAALCHALGQGFSTVHTGGHAIGLPIYELTSIVLRYGIDDSEELINKKIIEYTDLLKEIADKITIVEYEWADFITVDKK